MIDRLIVFFALSGTRTYQDQIDSRTGAGTSVGITSPHGLEHVELG